MINNIEIKDTENIFNSSTINKPQVYSTPSFGIKAKNSPLKNSDVFSHKATDEQIQKLKTEFAKVQSQQGIIGKSWNAIKKVFGGGSKKIEKIIQQCENGEISYETAMRAIGKYKSGQKASVEVVSDVTSAVASVFAYNTTVPKEKVSVAVGLAISTLTGATVKTGIKAGDAAIAGREYTKKELVTDAATGAVNGLVGPVSNAIGAKTTEALGKKFGLEVVTDGVKTVANASGKVSVGNKIKSLLTTQTANVKGGTLLKRASVLGVGMAIDGALSASSDNMVRAAIDGENVLEAGAKGFVSGAVSAPVVGGGFRVAAKAGKALNNKIITKMVLPDGIDTKFRQGRTGDCALLTMIDGIMNNEQAQSKIKNAITKSVGGDYYVKIGDKTVQVAKNAITDEMLSDVTGIRIFEQAYKQVQGEIDGGFADVVAKQFGLNPVHITSDLITDEMLDTIAKQKNNSVLSLGLNVDDFGAISPNGTNKHYFTIIDVDSASKKVMVTNPYDTSQLIELPYEQVTKTGLAIDGGTLTEKVLPNSVREAGEVAFKGRSVSDAVENIKKYLDSQGVDIKKFNKLLSTIETNDVDIVDVDTFAAMLKYNGVSVDEASEFLTKYMSKETGENISLAEWIDVFEGTADEAKGVAKLVKAVSKYKLIKDNDFFEAYHLSLSDADELADAITNSQTEKISEILRRSNPDFFERVGGKQYIVRNLANMNESLSNRKIPFGLFISPDNMQKVPVQINGEDKFFIFKNGTQITSSSHPNIDFDMLLESNMITTDALEIAHKKGFLPKIIEYKTNGLKGLSDKTKPVLIDTDAIMEKIREKGYSHLSSREMHALTDELRELYKNTDFGEVLRRDKNLKTKANAIYDVVDYLRRNSQNALNGTNVEISDHAYMRMIDRNLTTVVDNSSGNVLDFNEFIKLISDSAKKGNANITGFEGSNGIKMILGKHGSKIVIDSVM